MQMLTVSFHLNEFSAILFSVIYRTKQQCSTNSTSLGCLSTDVNVVRSSRLYEIGQHISSGLCEFIHKCIIHNANYTEVMFVRVGFLAFAFNVAELWRPATNGQR